MPSAVDPARVLVVDDHPVFRRGMAGLLAAEPWVGEVLEAGTAHDAVREAVMGRADVVAMDLRLPDDDGLTASARILAARPATRVLVLTMDDDPELVGRALRLGAVGYLLKRTDPEDIVTALGTVARGGLVLGPHVSDGALRALRSGPDVLSPPFDRLTRRELDILGLIADGRSNAAVARRCGVSEKTIRNQLSGLYAKIGAGDRVQAALMSRDAGIGPPES